MINSIIESVPLVSHDTTAFAKFVAQVDAYDKSHDNSTFDQVCAIFEMRH
jgi:hypothetical protein